MSTRATIHFEYQGKTEAIIYRHSDGYPSGLGNDLKEFLKTVAELRDTRFGDPCYLAAKFVVWQAAQYAGLTKTSKLKRDSDRLDFLSVGVVLKDPDDIEYRYHVECDGRGTMPIINVDKVMMFGIKAGGYTHRPLDEAKDE